MGNLKEYNPRSDYGSKKINEYKFLKAEITDLDQRQLKSKSAQFGISIQRLLGIMIRDFVHKS